MNTKLIVHIVFIVALVVSAMILASAGVSWLMQDRPEQILKLTFCGSFLLLFSGLIVWNTRLKSEKDRICSRKENFAIVAFSWLIATLFGAVPYTAVSGLYWYDALFESASGFSTTGASILEKGTVLYHGAILENGIESLSYGILFWRMLTHWLGGMGIVVLSLAILPMLNTGGGQMLYHAESTGLKAPGNQMTPRITSSAKILWCVYVSLTVAGTFLLRFGGMDWFDSVCHMFSVMATGGFSTRQTGVMYYDSLYIEGVLIFFMFVSSCNFMLHFRAITGKPREYWKDEEFRVFTWIVVIAVLLITLVLTLSPGTGMDPVNHLTYQGHFWTSLRVAAFQVVSLISSTGFITGDYTRWPAFTCAILFLISFVGGCGGSTAGGMKCVRALLLGKISFFEIRRCLYPHLQPNIRLNKVLQETATQRKTFAFFALYMGTYFIFVLLYPLLCPGMTLETSLSASLACLSNIGPGFGQIGPEFSYAWISAPAKCAMAFEMLLGRLELYTVLVLLNINFWKK